MFDAAAGCQHRINDKNNRVFDDVGELRIILVGLQGFFVPINSDVPNFFAVGIRGSDAVDHSQPGAQYRHDDHGFFEHIRFRICHRRFDLHF